MRKGIVCALVKKEMLQIIRDFSSILIAFLLPVILLFLFGFGINFDTNTVKIGIILEDKTPTTLEILDTMRHSRFLDIKVFNTRKAAEYALEGGFIKGFAVIRSNFTKRLKGYGAAAGAGMGNIVGEGGAKKAEIQVITDGSEPNVAKFVSAYIMGALGVYKAIGGHSSPEGYGAAAQSTGTGGGSSINIIQRFWYNPSLKSAYFILPGSLAIIMTMIGTVLTALVIAREWERGTMESLLTTDITKGEFLFSKYIAYFLLSMASILFSLFLIRFLFRVPFYGSYLAFMTVSALFMLGALGFGFFVSTISKDQFIASQIAGVVGFMPAMMLSGLIYEIDSMPWFLRALTCFIPARYYVSSITSLFLSGTIMKTIVLNSIILGFFALLMFVIVYKVTPETLEGEE